MLGRNNNQNQKRAVIVGCGISGASAAEELIKLGYQVIILEKNHRVGGKLKSVGNQDMGAMVLTSNYPAIDTIAKKNISVDEVLPGDDSVNFVVFGTNNPTLAEKVKYAVKLAWQYGKFALEVWRYNSTSQSLQSHAPKDHALDFDSYAKKNNMQELANFMKIWVPGMGYGALSTNYVFRVINYMGYGTIPSLCLGKTLFGKSLYSVHGGFQTIVEKMVSGMDVRTGVKIEKIRRLENKVIVTYSSKDSAYTNDKTEVDDNDAIGDDFDADGHSGEESVFEIEADLLVLTMSPKYWENLGMELTHLEKECIDKLEYVRYPVAICDIQGYPPTQLFVPEALESDGLGHIGFISTKDKTPREDGSRRVIVYMNLAPGQDDFSLNEDCKGRQVLLSDLKKLGYGNDQVRIIQTKDWKDYNPTLPYALGIELEKKQGESRTLYLGSYSPLSFETVAAAEKYARDTIKRVLTGEKKYFSNIVYENLNRAYTFFFKLNRQVHHEPQQVFQPKPNT